MTKTLARRLLIQVIVLSYTFEGRLPATGTRLPADRYDRADSYVPPRSVVPISERAFTPVWNIRNSAECLARFGVDLNLGAYGIETNLAFFSHRDIGLYPYINLNGKFINGGLPQLVNMTSHLEKAADDIIAAIPDESFSGLAVIDWEFWYPIWDRNYIHSHHIYLNKSLEMVRRHHPNWDSGMVEAVATLEFEQAAKSLFESTFLLARQLRPRALWGFYHYPYCGNNAHVKYCNSSWIADNNRMSWFFDESSALYPSIYLKYLTSSKNSTAVYVNTILDEAFRVREKSKSPKVPILSYCRFNYSYTQFYLNLEDLNDTILLSAERGVTGVVLWGDNYDINNRAVCLHLQGYIKTALGPLVLKITKAASRCSAALCSNHGRCTGKILTCSHLEPHQSARAPSRGSSDMNSGSTPGPSDCECQCYAGWSGPNCDEAVTDTLGFIK